MRTSPAALQRLGLKRLGLELPDDAHLGVACWQRADQWLIATDIAYQLHYQTVRPSLCDRHGRGGVSRHSVRLVAAARARFADWNTGRNSRPTVTTIMALTKLSESVVQRATRFLRIVGAATEILRGRLRTLDERLASWRLGDKGRGWASVWALHPPQNPELRRRLGMVTPHLRSGHIPTKTTNEIDLLTSAGWRREPQRPRSARPQPRKGRIGRREWSPPDTTAMLLARKWSQHPDSPRWVHRHTPAGWARILTAAAQHQWCPEDLNQLLRDHISLGGWIADSPTKPIALVGWLLKKHGDLDDRPAAADMAREAEIRAQVARRELQNACVRCDDYGWTLGADGTPTEPARKCVHGTR